MKGRSFFISATHLSKFARFPVFNLLEVPVPPVTFGNNHRCRVLVIVLDRADRVPILLRQRAAVRAVERGFIHGGGHVFDGQAVDAKGI